MTGHNPFVDDFVASLERRFNKDSALMTHGEWMCQNTTLNKKPFNFNRYPFQRKIADDMHDNLDCMKPSQVGLTEIQIRKVLAILARTDNISIIYTMPNDKMFKRISKGRIKPIIDNDTKAFGNMNGNKNSMDMLQIGSSFLYVTGSGESDATSINADMIFNDEVDLTDAAMLALFNSRVQGSDLRIKQRFSTPTYQGFGIHKGYAASDQHEYMIKCRGCNTWQIPLFSPKFVHIPKLMDRVKEWTDIEAKMVDEGLINLDRLKVCCEKCHRPLNLADTENRQWVARFPNRVHHRGYHIRPFSTHILDPRYVMTQLFDYKRRNNMKGFYNTVLGETYSSGENRLEANQIENCMVQSGIMVPPQGTPVFIGIDVGQTCHIVLGAGSVEELHAFQFETCHVDVLDARVKALRGQFNIVGGGMDKYPYTPTANAMRNATNGIVMPVEYGSGREFNVIKDEFQAPVGVRACRTTLLDAVSVGVRTGAWKLSGYGDDRETIITHLQDMVREDRPTDTGENEPVWVKLNGNDHYFHALAFLVAGMRNRNFVVQTAEYERVGTDVFALDMTPNILGRPDDLIGFGGSGRSVSKIITRY